MRAINGVRRGWAGRIPQRTPNGSPNICEEIHALDEILTELEKQPGKSLVLDTTEASSIRETIC